jgi:hypothetical protein
MFFAERTSWAMSDQWAKCSGTKVDLSSTSLAGERAHASASLARYFVFFNTRRPHTSLDRRTPDAVCFESLPLAQAALKTAEPHLAERDLLFKFAGPLLSSLPSAGSSPWAGAVSREGCRLPVFLADLEAERTGGESPQPRRQVAASSNRKHRCRCGTSRRSATACNRMVGVKGFESAAVI